LTGFSNAYNNLQGEAQATLHAHVNSIKVYHGTSKGVTANAVTSEPSKKGNDDLPF